MIPDNTTMNGGNQGLMNSVFIGNGLLGTVGSAENHFDGFNLGGSKLSTAPSFFVAIIDVVLVRALKPMCRIVANAVIASVQHVKRIRVETVDNEPSHSCGVSVITFDRHLALLSPNRAAYGGCPRPTFVRAALVNVLPVSSFLFLGKRAKRQRFYSHT